MEDGEDKEYNMRSGDPLQMALGEVKEIKIGERNNEVRVCSLLHPQV